MKGKRTRWRQCVNWECCQVHQVRSSYKWFQRKSHFIQRLNCVLLAYLLSYYLLTYLLSYFLTYLLTFLITHSLHAAESSRSSQLVKKFPAFYGTRRFITAFTSARHLSLSWASSIQSTPPHPTSWRSIFILFSYLRLGLPNSLFPSGFPTKPSIPLSSPPFALHASSISFFSNNIRWAVQIIKLFIR